MRGLRHSPWPGCRGQFPAMRSWHALIQSCRWRGWASRSRAQLVFGLTPHLQIADRAGMKWQAVVVASLVGGMAFAQVPPAPPGTVKKAEVKKDAQRIAERAKDMRQSITKGRQVKAHVKVVVRLKNGNRLTGVVKDGRLVERVDGLRFVDAQARDQGAGIRLWYSGGTRSYIFVPFVSLKNYEVLQRLSQKQLMDIENEMQMAEKRAKEREAKAAREAKGSASGVGESNGPAPGTLDSNTPGNVDGSTVDGGANEAAKSDAGKPDAKPVTADDAASQVAQAKQELAWAQLLRSYPPKAGWNAAKKDEISRRQVVIGVLPSKFELEFVDKFDDWLKACAHNKVDPNEGVIKPTESKRDRRRAERERARGR
jgi:hypothetical protein